MTFSDENKLYPGDYSDFLIGKIAVSYVYMIYIL